MIKLIKYNLCILIVMLFLISLTGCKSASKQVTNVSAKKITMGQWKKDIDYLGENLPKDHTNIYHSITKENFDKEILDLKNDAPKLKDYQIKCRLAEIVASVGDAHTNLLLDSDETSTYPIEVQWFNKDLRVVGIDKVHKDILGKKLISINGISIDKVMEKMEPLISHENSQWLKAFDAQYVMMPDILKFLGVTSKDKVEFSFEDDNSKINKIELYPGKVTQANMVRVVDEMPIIPLNLQYNINDQKGNLYWDKYIPKDKILYFQYNQCVYSDFEKCSQYILNVIADKKIDKFIIDLRNNGGGDSGVITPLVSSLADIDKLKGKIYVIIGKNTFSSGVLAAVDFMNYTGAKFYGEPTGGNVNGYGDVKYLVLPSSKLKISYSTKEFDICDKFKENFIPDVTINESFKDYKKGIDDVYEAIKK